ncbi:MAG: BON domain-containing protein [Ignavibacteria bacterium]
MKRSSLCSVAAAASVALIAGLAAVPASAQTSQSQQGTGQAQQGGSDVNDMNDYLITTNVKSAMAREAQGNTADIQVSTDNGVVQLSGFASSPQEASHAEDVARRVPGVKDVKNSIDVKQSPQQPQQQSSPQQSPQQ